LEYHVKGAAKYLWLEAKHLWVSCLRLPAAHQAMGEEVYRTGLLRQRLEPLFNRFDYLSQRLAANQHPAEGERARPGESGLRAAWRAVVCAGVAVVATVRTVIIGRQRRAVLREMGRQACQIEPVPAGAGYLVARVQNARQQLARLRTELARLAVVPVGQVLSPRRLAWLVVIGLLSPLAWSLWIRLRSGMPF
jgi:hypothetical protein